MLEPIRLTRANLIPDRLDPQKRTIIDPESIRGYDACVVCVDRPFDYLPTKILRWNELYVADLLHLLDYHRSREIILVPFNESQLRKIDAFTLRPPALALV